MAEFNTGGILRNIKERALERMTHDERERVRKTFSGQEAFHSKYGEMYYAGQEILAETHLALAAVFNPEAEVENATQVITNAMLACSGLPRKYAISDHRYHKTG